MLYRHRRMLTLTTFVTEIISKTMQTIQLNIDLISEELYLLILEEFKKQHPNVGDLDNWVIKADYENL